MGVGAGLKVNRISYGVIWVATKYVAISDTSMADAFPALILHVSIW